MMNGFRLQKLLCNAVLDRISKSTSKRCMLSGSSNFKLVYIYTYIHTYTYIYIYVYVYVYITPHSHLRGLFVQKRKFKIYCFPINGFNAKHAHVYI